MGKMQNVFICDPITASDNMNTIQKSPVYTFEIQVTHEIRSVNVNTLSFSILSARAPQKILPSSAPKNSQNNECFLTT